MAVKAKKRFEQLAKREREREKPRAVTGSQKRALEEVFAALGVEGPPTREQREIALRLVAVAIYPKTGRKKEWTSKRIARLKRRFAKQKEKTPDASTIAICERLSKLRFYRGVTPSTLRRKLSPKVRKGGAIHRKKDDDDFDWDNAE